MAQWLGLCALIGKAWVPRSLARAWVPSLAGELKTHKLLGVGLYSVIIA